MNIANMKKWIHSFWNLLCTNKKVIIIIWFIPVILAIIRNSKGIPNNYLIFKYVYYHMLEQVNLYTFNPELYGDCNHYGPVFALLIAPFTYLPEWISPPLISILIAASLCIAIYHLPIDWRLKVIIYIITANDMFITTLAFQTNPLITALIIGSFIMIKKEKDFWAACFIMLGFFIKLYGIVGLAFFFFSKNKIRFIYSLAIWGIVFFVLPMFISSPSFVVQSYSDWHDLLAYKNVEKAYSLLEDISVMGMMRRISGDRDLSNLIVILPAICLFLLQYLKVKLYDNLSYQLAILASALLFTVLFSSGSESPTYIIAMVGVAIWFVIQKEPYSKYIIFLLIYTIIFSSMSTSDLLPLDIRRFIKQYALKALPGFVVWLTLIVQILCMNIRCTYLKNDLQLKEGKEV